MNKLFFLIFLFSNFLFSQQNEKFLTDFLLDTELKSVNSIKNYSSFDFSNLWGQTDSSAILGIIGDEHQRLKIKLISIEKNPFDSNEYIVYGKSMVKENICDFIGVIKITEIYETKEIDYGIDDDYKGKGIKSQGLLVANYEFKENKNTKNSGIFKGKLYSKWYTDLENKIYYNDIQKLADNYSNNAFIGIWKGYNSKKEKICNWGDYRVPNTNLDFDIGAGEFSPNEDYLKNGWENYQKAFLHNNEDAKKEEFKEWWK